MTTLLIYQLENTSHGMEDTVRPYEEKYPLFVLAEDSSGNTIYQSTSSFPTPEYQLIQDVFDQAASQEVASEKRDDAPTSQGGIYEVASTNQDHYYAIPATITTSDHQEYQAVFLYQICNLNTILSKLLPHYLLIWILSCGVVVLLIHLLLKRAFRPTEQILKSQKDFVASASHELKSPPCSYHCQ